ncbi:MAG: ABC transporter ATP-binding protein [Capsulimonadales bacterium]|nr:ABC transporter ATP-binding protein [Capsulimonadales bacterium]
MTTGMRSQTATALSLDNLNVSYSTGPMKPKRRVVEDLSLEVQAGEVVGFLGPNGAGKSSTIKAVMGFLTPDSGTIRVFDEPAGTPAANSKIGYLPEVALYYPFLTPMETLWLYGKLQRLGGKALRDESYRLLNLVGLGGKEKQPLRTFSKGMQQRLGIAQALLGNPDLLVLDEVTSGVDPIGRRHLREILADVRSGGTTIFLSSHELDEVAQLCDRVILIHGGRKQDERPVDDRFRQGIGSALENYFITTIQQAEEQYAKENNP